MARVPVFPSAPDHILAAAVPTPSNQSPLKELIIYCPCSFGGTYDYILHQLPAYQELGIPVEVWMPANAKAEGPGIRKELLPDIVEGNTRKKKLHFLRRSFASPLKFWNAVKNRKNALILWNDFDQSTALIWAAKVKAERLPSQVTAVVLHDPDRDAYPPNLAYSQYSMLRMMDTMDLGYFHEVLCEKVYYQRSHTHYVSIPFGPYELPAPDTSIVNELRGLKDKGYQLASITGNIRAEKNYHLAIEALVHHPKLILLIAGRRANSGVRVEDYMDLAERLGVRDRIWLQERYFTDAELAGVIQESDVVLLAYSATFKSQSAIFANLVPFSSNLVASDGESALAMLVKQYGLGELVRPDDLQALVTGIGKALQYAGKTRPGWKTYQETYTWVGNAKRIWDAGNEVAAARLS